MNNDTNVNANPHVISDRHGLYYSKAGAPDAWTANEDLAEKYPEKADADMMCKVLRQEGRDCFVL